MNETQRFPDNFEAILHTLIEIELTYTKPTGELPPGKDNSAVFLVRKRGRRMENLIKQGKLVSHGELEALAMRLVTLKEADRAAEIEKFKQECTRRASEG